MKVTSNKTISFPQFVWGIHAGEERELPSDKEAQKAILAHADIEEVGKLKSSANRDVSSKKEDELNGK